MEAIDQMMMKTITRYRNSGISFRPAQISLKVSFIYAERVDDLGLGD